MRLVGTTSAAVAVAALVASLFTTMTTPVAADTPPPSPVVRVAEAADEVSAARAAVAQKSPVEVTGERTETRTVYAQPDGTMKAQLTLRPVRLRRGDGWVGADATLERRDDGTAGPKAADVDLAFSGGGDGPMVRYAKDDKTITLSWPGPLPAPELSGDTATYRDVLPGVDLRLTADVEGFSQDLVVKERGASLTSVRLGLRTGGVKLQATDGGGLEAVDDSGAVVFAAGPSAMWDAGQTHTGVARVDVDGDTLTLTPDQALPADPATVYPVTIDPPFRTQGPQRWTSVLSGGNGPWPNTSGEYPFAQSGHCNWSGCGVVGVAHSYFQFDTSFLAGQAEVLGAGLDLWVTHTVGCSTGVTQSLWKAWGPIDPWPVWNTQPNGQLIRSFAPPSVNPDHGCGGNKLVPGPSTDVKGWLNFGGTTTFELTGVNDSDQNMWTKYDAFATRLNVTYNSPPYVPADVSITPPLPAPCKFCENMPYVGQPGITLHARLSDPNNEPVRPLWHLYVDGNRQGDWWGDYKGSGQLHDRFVDLGAWKHNSFDWYVKGDDGAHGDTWTHTDNWARGALFRTDLDPPTKAPQVTSTLYRPDNAWHGGAGIPGTFTFDALSAGDTTVNDIDHFVYGWQWPPTQPVDADALGGKVTLRIAPSGDGPQDLYVRSVDRGGNPGPATQLHLYVRAGNGPLAQWSFQGDARDEAYLGGRDGTLNGDAAFGPGAVSTGLRLTAGGHMSAPNAVRTDDSFSVSAWVKPDVLRPDLVMSAASQYGSQASGFYLDYRGDQDKWTFMLAGKDEAGASGFWAAARQRPQAGRWTQLTGVYDRAAGEVRLYVNGELGARTAVPAGFVPWNAAGKVALGREQYNGAETNYWYGSLDEVKIYDRALTDADAEMLAGDDNVQAGQWKFEELTGTTAQNGVDGGEALGLRDGASFTGDGDGDGVADGGAVGGGLRLAGGYAATSGPVVATDQSFTVSAWAWAETAPADQHVRAVLSQDGAQTGGFFLDYRNDIKRWTFMLAGADQNDPAPYMASSAAEPATRTWTHLTGVFDRAANKIRLYVNGHLDGETALPAGFTPWSADGGLTVGREKWNGLTGNLWDGMVDEIRTYNRALSATEIQGIVSRDDVRLGAWALDGNAKGDVPAHDGAVTGAPAWVAGQSSTPDPTDLAVRLNGSGEHISAAHLVDGRQSFAVAAWARLDRAGGTRTLLSQDGGRVSAFLLSATPDGKWSFGMHGTDTDNADRKQAIGGVAQVGVWTHLVGTYDAATHRLALYVNGTLAGVADDALPRIFAAGGVQIGRGKWNGGNADFFPGAIDDVAVYGRILFADEIRVLAGRDLSLAHDWTLDEGAGSTAADAVGARPGKLEGAATHVPGRIGNAVQLNPGDDASGDAVTTTGVDVRTDADFTVAAWVRMTRTCDPGSRATCRFVAVSADGAAAGATGSKFRLGHLMDRQHPLGVWSFEMPESADPAAQPLKAAVATLPDDLTQWVHLAGVYDKTAKRIWLYVNGTRRGDGTEDTPWDGAGGLAIGRARTTAGDPGEWFHGQVDDVRLYQGLLDADRIGNLYNAYPKQDGSADLPAADAGWWTFDEGAGTTAADTSGHALTATMTGTATWHGGRSRAGAWLDGANGWAETAGRALDTSRDFSASAWVALNQGATGNRTAVAQDGTNVSAFLLQWNAAANRWAVIVPSADQNDPPNNLVLTGTETVYPGQWTHLLVSYNATLGQLRLYVNGRLSAAQTGVTVQPSNGRLSIGRARWNGQNTDRFPGGIDDVRLYGKALTDAQVRKVYDDLPAVLHGMWRFDDQTVRDYSWRNNPTTASGGVSYVPGVDGKALQLDGTTGSASAQQLGAPPMGSLTVSAWARLSRNDRIQTVAANDGTRRSIFALQYRPNLDRWVFAAPLQDSDDAELVYAYSAQPPVLNQWVHLTGVYDHAAGQLRLYVNGVLSGRRDKVTLFVSGNGFTIGRDKLFGQPSGFFSGAIDEVQTDLGSASEVQIARRAGWPLPQTGQLGRYVNAAGEHYTGPTSAQPREGYHAELVFGRPVTAGTNTRILYGCRTGADYFTSIDPACETPGATVTGQIGVVYAVQPANIPTVALYRCRNGQDAFDSLSSTCEGAGTREQTLGYAAAYAMLSRYNNSSALDHYTTTQGGPPGYYNEGPHGWLPTVAQPGTQPLMSCRDGADQFVSLDAACEGKAVLGVAGYAWPAAPDGLSTRAVYRCLIGAERYTSADPNCEGYTVERLLGYVLTSIPSTTPTFP
ncbi:LamG domain-containing protein [Streptosporangiaceae bacterium NEAU-GS5]|nr:LamG domain-containing protein [Streptosporangiaceae bacterium NEAU-GS5]